HPDSLLLLAGSGPLSGPGPLEQGVEGNAGLHRREVAVPAGLDEPRDETIGGAGQRGWYLVGGDVAAEDQVVGRGVNGEDRVGDPSRGRGVLPDVITRGRVRGVALHGPVQGRVVPE